MKATDYLALICEGLADKELAVTLVSEVENCPSNAERLMAGCAGHGCVKSFGAFRLMYQIKNASHTVPRMMN